MSNRDAYFESRDLSKSAIDMILECPAIYKAWRDGAEDRNDSAAKIFGGMFHKLCLEPEDFDAAYAVTDLNLATKEGKEWKSGLPEGVAITKEGDYEKALLMSQAVRDHPQARFLFQNFTAEKPVYWTRPDGIACKCLPDIRATVGGVRFCADLKSTENASPAAIQRDIAKYHYYRQAAWYLDGLASIGEPCEDFLFIFVEKTSPYLVTMCQLDAAALEKGRKENERAVEILKDCLRTGLYPCYTRDILTISLPSWAA